MPPTELCNEGWMLRLLLDWHHRNPSTASPLRFTDGASWFSEGRLASPFIRGVKPREGYTHADGVIGQFTIKPGERGEILLQRDARQLVVIEAKMGSKLSAGTTHAPAYDQAARNVACMAELLTVAGIAPGPLNEMERLAFFVVAPESRIEAGVFEDLVTQESIRAKIQARVEGLSEGAARDSRLRWIGDVLDPTLDHMELGVLSWENLLEDVRPVSDQESLRAFYVDCLRFNLA